MTASGLTLEGKDVLVIEGHSSITGEPAKVKLTDYGFEFFFATSNVGDDLIGNSPHGFDVVKYLGILIA